MFDVFKKKLKDALSIFTRKAEEKVKEEVVEEKKPEVIAEFQKPTPKAKIKEEEKPERKEKVKEEVTKEAPKKSEAVQKRDEKKEEKKGFFERITTIFHTKITESTFDEIFWDFEVALLESNVAMEVIEKIKKDMKGALVDKQIKKSEIKNEILNTLRKSIQEILTVPTLDLVERIRKKEEKPFTILFLGLNGAGKSITAAKVAYYLKNHNLAPLLAAGDTFRAAGATQLSEYAKPIHVPVIRQEMGADSCAIIYDAILSGKARKVDAVLADTAGRMHSNVDLGRELEKIVRVNKPDMKILVVEATTGSDVLQQAELFDKMVHGVDAVIVTKLDSYEKGGAILSVSYLLKKPILFLGTGQGMDDLIEYHVEKILESLGL